ncbi:MAG TPA: TspO/MBR family protein [Candidatus Saccharimonadales bacterium]
MKQKDAAKLIIMILLPPTVGALGSLITFNEISGWYAELTKPAFNPPSWLFGPVWTLLYILMGIAAFLVWRRPGDHGLALSVFATQLTLNLAWSFIFFGAHLLLAAFVEILLLLAVIIWTIVVFARISRIAAWLLVPYLLWVSFATVLTASIYFLNN